MYGETIKKISLSTFTFCSPWKCLQNWLPNFTSASGALHIL